VICAGKLRTQGNSEGNDVEYAVSLYCYLTRQPFFIQTPAGPRRYRVTLRWFGKVTAAERWADVELERRRVAHEMKWGAADKAMVAAGTSVDLVNGARRLSSQFQLGAWVGSNWRKLEDEAFRIAYDAARSRGCRLPPLDRPDRFTLQWKGVPAAPRLWGWSLTIDGLDERHVAKDVQTAVVEALAIRRTEQE
jgi:hypothetical protein